MKKDIIDVIVESVVMILPLVVLLMMLIFYF